MKNLLFILTAFILFSSALKADDFTDAIIKAKKNLSAAMNSYNEKDLLKVRGEFERILQLKKQEWIVNYYIALVDYTLAASSMGNNNTANLKKYNQSGLSIIDKSILQRDDFADAYVLKYALTFYRWIYEQDKMADIIAQSTEAKQNAEKYDPANPRLFLVDGMSMFYTPAAFGGGVDRALPVFEKSLEHFKNRSEKEEYYPDWGKDLTYGYLVLSYAKRNDEGDKAKSDELYEKASKEFPDSGFLKGYVKSELAK